MARYPVYLEIADDGRCLAHVPDLPGCVVRAPTPQGALRQLPGAIRDHHAWLRRHDEPAPPADEPIEIEVVAEHTGIGPFDPGDAAALLPPDREPVTPAQMERCFRLMAHSRADLLALVRDLAEDLLDWQPDRRSFSLRRLLRHVGNAEEWYVSRLVPPETLPPEWEEDEHLPVLAFLEMERRTAVARLRQLTEAERGGVFHPTCWTDHPEEAWTAGKALRRALEHERQHTAQARRILAAYRRHLLAHLAAGRAGLLEQLLTLDERALTGEIVHGDWTAKDILAHVVAWDRWEEQAMRCMVAGETPDFTALGDFDVSNAIFVAEWRDRSLGEVLAALQAARAEWVAWLEGLPEEEFFRARSYEGWDWTFSTVPLRVQWEHDARHGERIGAWREARGLKEGTGCKAVLLAALTAAREELLAAAALVPADERASRRVCGIWTLKDVVGHIADWESFGAEGLRHMAAGQAPQVEHIQDIDAWNQAHAQARRDQPWEAVWVDLRAARRAFLEVLEGMSQAELGRSFPFPWGPEGTPYQWVGVYFAHDREHARGLRGDGS
jgi:uncharacterized damage-inducible protein DinB/predicted RNase H-like HicB family nuclease